MGGKFTYEIAVAIIFGILLALLMNPFGLWMPSAVEMAVIIGLVVLFAVFSGLVWRERGGDERERLHRLLADRFGYLAGAAVLVVGIAVQGLDHRVDNWLLGALGCMIAARIAGFIYSKVNH